ncbi:AlpA family phage regulatory protein [Phenylobacterium sp.]|uniref:helix-turn-helix transcriptional regulator n=1 Tax=Phenylobacterium sp. TaxID=1871053 RepID=UPI00286B0383|nr:AlpA family phage regulatory protein [Phenylobacterium sp.]
MTAPGSETFDTAGDRILPWGKVRDLAGISRTTAWRLQNAGDFPRPVVISRGRVGWRESEVAAWKASLAPRGEVAPPRGALLAYREPRLSPARPAASASASPGPPPAPSQAPPQTAAAAKLVTPPPIVETPPKRRARSRRTHADQMSFDF